MWEARTPQLWSESAELYEAIAQRALKIAQPFWAYDITTEGIECFPDNLRLHQIRAMCLSQSGSPNAAQEILLLLEKKGHVDSETLSLIGRTYKDLWKGAVLPEKQKQYLDLAIQYYRKAFEHSQEYYPGINAATLAVMKGDLDEAKALAKDVQRICLAVADKDKSYWRVATQAEASLILGNIDGARAWYSEACDLARNDQTAISSIRSQARLLLHYLGRNQNVLDVSFKIGSVVAFSGHMVDAPARSSPRFPEKYEEAVGSEIAKQLESLDARIGYSSAASGSDMLFLEAMLHRGGEIHIILPCEKDSFIESSVANAGGDWVKRFEKLLIAAASVGYLSTHKFSNNPAIFSHASEVFTGMAKLKSRVLDTELATLAVWDGKQGDGLGGTDEIVGKWENLGFKFTHIDLLKIVPQDEKSSSVPSVQKSESGAAGQSVYDTAVKAILFTDVVGFSKLTEKDVPIYLEYFLGQAAQLLDQTDYKPIIRNTWGDALFLVFDFVGEAGNFALQLRKMVSETDWTGHGLSRELSVRIGLHAGPVTLYSDPVTQLASCSGSNVNHAARIEPITEEGQVYASHTFSALATIDPISKFRCEYVGQKQLAKKFGSDRLYIIREK